MRRNQRNAKKSKKEIMIQKNEQRLEFLKKTHYKRILHHAFQFNSMKAKNHHS